MPKIQFRTKSFRSLRRFFPVGRLEGMESPQAISDLKELLGKSVLVGITRIGHNDKLVSQEQFHGQVESLDGDLVHIRISGTNADFTLPPEPSAFTKAQPGHYRLRGSGEVIIDPDFTTSWTVRAPKPEGPQDEN